MKRSTFFFFSSSCCLAVLFAALCGFSVHGQNAPPMIVGRIIDDSGTGLPGATVIYKNGSRSAVTDASGQFSIQANGDSTRLIARYIGFEPREVWCRPGRTLTISLSPSADVLQSVAITASTGYQDLPKERATGSFNVISNKLFNEQPGTTVMDRLEAIGSAVNVDRSTSTTPNIMVRGMSTIQGPRSALIILDNFPYEGSLDNINPNDVETVTVLKDAAAASIWGARAGNGVVVITTKKAKFNQPVKAAFSSTMTAIAEPDPYAIPQLNPSEMIDLEIFLYGKGYYNSLITSTSKPALTPVIEILVKKTAGALTATEADGQINALRQIDFRDQLKKYVYSSGFNQQYALDISGGSATANWLFSGGYDKNVNSLSASYNRLNLKLSNTFRPMKQLTATAGIYFTSAQTGSGKSTLSDYSANGNLPSYTQLADAGGKAMSLAKNYSLTYIATAGNGKLMDWNYYPLTDYKHSTSTRDLKEIVGNLSVNYQLTKGVSAEVRYQYERQQAEDVVLNDIDSYYTRDLINRFTQINGTTGAITYKVPKGGIRDNATTGINAQNARVQLNVSRSWGAHGLSAIGGAEARNISGWTEETWFYGLHPERLTSINVDQTTTYPSFVNGALGTIPGNNNLSRNTNRYISAFANAAYTFRERYTLSASGRRDASNLFGVSFNDKWTVLSSFGAAWDISAEPFWRIAALPFLKLRATYGASGNTDPSRSAITSISYPTVVNPTQTPVAQISSTGNPQLKWERITTINVGLDFRTAANRVSGSVELYFKRGSDLFGPAELELTTGLLGSVTTNVASMKGRGLDLDLNSLNTTGRIKWTTRLNLSLNTDEITRYNLNNFRANNFVNTGSSARVGGVVGRPVYGIYAYRWAGLDPATGDPQGYIAGKVSKDYTGMTSGTASSLDDVIFVGRILPPVFGSVGNSLSFGPFSVSAAVLYKFGHYFRKTALSYNTLFTRTATLTEYRERWQNPGDEQHTNVPSLIYPNVSARDAFYLGSEVHTEKADHVRLQYVTGSWELTRTQWKRLPMKRLNVALNASNLGILWRANKSGIDPDYRNNLPLKTYSLTLRTSL